MRHAALFISALLIVTATFVQAEQKHPLEAFRGTFKGTAQAAGFSIDEKLNINRYGDIQVEVSLDERALRFKIGSDFEGSSPVDNLHVDVDPTDVIYMRTSENGGAKVFVQLTLRKDTKKKDIMIIDYAYSFLEGGALVSAVSFHGELKATP